MALPAAVQKQIDEANRIAAEIYPKAALEVQQAAEAGGTPPSPPVVAQIQTPDPEQKYKVLQGKYNAEVPRLQAQLRGLAATNQSLQSQLTGTQTLLASFSPGDRTPVRNDGVPLSATKRLVNDEEITAFGRDLYDFVQRTAVETVMPQVDNRLRPMSQQLERTSQAANAAVSTAAQTKEEKVHAMLAEQVPTYLQLNEDPNFHAWLDQVDPYAGELRGELLKRAYSRHDGPRVVAFFKGFLNEDATVSPPLPTPDAGIPTKTLDELVAPGTVRAGAAAGTQDGANKRIWTRADIAKFYKDVSGGKYDQKQDMATAIEADIFAARNEGRIR